MTPIEVVQASAGAAHLDAVPPDVGQTETVEVVGTLNSGGLSFNVLYQFHDRRSLSIVKLELTSGSCYDAWHALSGKYGEPNRTAEFSATAASAWWRSDKDNLDIALDDDSNSCNIYYRPLRTGDGSGL
jgi:hypothetical protein